MGQIPSMFSVLHVWMWEVDHKESWVPKNWCLWTEVLEKTLESLLDCKEIKPVNPKENQSWILFGRPDAEPKLQYFGPLMWRTDFLEKTLVLEKIEGGRRRGQQRMRCWIESLTQWAWVWASSGSWWQTGELGILQESVRILKGSAAVHGGRKE